MMIIKNICNFIPILLCLVLLNGCPKPGSYGDESSESKKGEEQVDNLSDPLELLTDNEIVPALYPVNGELSRSGNLIVFDDFSGDNSNDSSSDNLITAIDTVNSQAFKIQILTSIVYWDVRQAKIVAEEIFDRPIFLDYEVPYYKLRVGSFIDRDQAEDYLPQVRMAGYNDAWVVVTNTAVKSLSPLYDNEPLPVMEDSLSGELQNQESDTKTEKTVADE
jgi:hypothetical protein